MNRAILVNASEYDGGCLGAVWNDQNQSGIAD